MTSRPAVSAHQGGKERHRPATLEAYADAVTLGAEYVEIDVRRLKDGTLVCHHAARVGGTGPLLSQLSYRQLCDAVGYQVPTLPMALDVIAGRSLAHLDLKEHGYEEQAVRLAVQTLGEDGVVVTTVEDDAVRAIGQRFPGVRTALSLGRGNDEITQTVQWWARPLRLVQTRHSELFPLRRIRACGARWVAVHKVLALCGVLAQCARHGIGAMVWTVDEDSLIDRFLQDPRIDVLVTNRPAYTLQRRDTLRTPRRPAS